MQQHTTFSFLVLLVQARALASSTRRPKGSEILKIANRRSGQGLKARVQNWEMTYGEKSR